MTVQEYAVKLRGNISKIIKGKDDRIDLNFLFCLDKKFLECLADPNASSLQPAFSYAT